MVIELLFTKHFITSLGNKLNNDLARCLWRTYSITYGSSTSSLTL